MTETSSPSTPPHAVTSDAELVFYTAPDIARRLDKDPSTVYRAIIRLHLQPIGITEGGISLYDCPALEELRTALHPSDTTGA